jgi:uncharacterized protein (TIGR02284 family)
MADDRLDHVKSLHTLAIDARNGYREAERDAEGQGLSPLFHDMIALHETNADELAAELARHGEVADSSGSFMTTIHRAIMSIRSLFGGLDQSVLPGLIDGETRNVSHYREALDVPDLPVSVRELLATQRSRLEAALASMRALQAASGATA